MVTLLKKLRGSLKFGGCHHAITTFCDTHFFFILTIIIEDRDFFPSSILRPCCIDVAKSYCSNMYEIYFFLMLKKIDPRISSLGFLSVNRKFSDSEKSLAFFISIVSIVQFCLFFLLNLGSSLERTLRIFGKNNHIFLGYFSWRAVE